MDLTEFQSELSKLLKASELTIESVRAAMKETRDDIYADAEKFNLPIEEPFWNCVGLGRTAVFAFFESEFSIFVIDCDERTLMNETDSLAMAETEECREMLRTRFGKSEADIEISRTLAESWMSEH